MSYNNDKELSRSPTLRKNNSIFPIQEVSSPKIQLLLKNSDVSETFTPLSGKSKMKNEDNGKQANNNEIDSNSSKKITKTFKSKLPFQDLGRTDKYGYPIIKGGKKHKICFREEMVKVIRVENWKIYNLDMSDGNNKNKCCIII